MPDFGFVGPSYTGRSIYQDDQESINWYCEVDPLKQPGERGQFTLYPTPGLTLKCATQTAEVRGMRTSPDGSFFLAIVGSSLYKVSAAYVATVVGTLHSTSGPVHITDNGRAAYFCDGLCRYTYTFASAQFAIVPDSDGPFLGGIRADVADGFLVYSEPGTQNWAASSLNLTTTPALSVGAKNGAPDNLQALIVNQRMVYLLGTQTSEVWINVGSFPFPFSRIPGASTQHGLAAVASVCTFGDSFAFVSQDARGQGLILMAQGYTFTQISNHAVTQSLVGKTISDAVAYTRQSEGHEFYCVSFPSANITWVYDLATQYWHKWLSLDEFDQYRRHRVQCAIQFQGLTLGGDYLNGNIYSIDQDVYTDNGAPIRRLRRCPHLTSDLNQQFFSLLQIQFQPGVGLTTGQGSDPQAMLRFSDDGGSTWGREHWRSIGVKGRYKNRAIWRRLGTARDRVYEVTVSDPINATIVSANLKAEVGEN